MSFIENIKRTTNGLLPDSRVFWQEFWEVNNQCLYGTAYKNPIDALPVFPQFTTNRLRIPVLIELGEDWIIHKTGASYKSYIKDFDYQQQKRSECANLLAKEIFFYLKPKVDTSSLLHGSIYGNPIEYPEDSTPWLAPILHDSEDIKKLIRKIESLDISNAGLVPEFVQRYNLLKRPYRWRILHDPTSVHGPGTILGFLFGIQEFLLFLYDEPFLMKSLIDLIARVTVQYSNTIRNLTGAPQTGVGVFDDVAGLLSPDLFKKFLLPAYRIIYEELAPKPGDDRFLHNDAAVAHLLPFFRELGVNGINPDSNTPLCLIRQQLPKALIFGGIDPILLQQGSPYLIFETARKSIHEVGKDGGLILTTAGSINMNTPYENLLSLCYASFVYGNLD